MDRSKLEDWRDAASNLPFGGLTPAECLLLLDLERVDAKEMIRVTLLDLLSRKAMGYEERERRTLILRRRIKEPFLLPKAGGFHERLKNHERLLVGILGEEREISLKRFARKTARKLGKARAFKDDYVVVELIRTGLIVKERKLVLFERLALTDDGRRVKDALNGLMNHAERHVDGWLRTDRDKAGLFLALVGTNVLIMPDVMAKLKSALEPNSGLSLHAEFQLGSGTTVDVHLPDTFSETFTNAYDAVQFDASSFDASFDSLGAGAFDGGGGGGDGGGGGGGDGGGGGGG